MKINLYFNSYNFDEDINTGLMFQIGRNSIKTFECVYTTWAT